MSKLVLRYSTSGSDNADTTCRCAKYLALLLMLIKWRYCGVTQLQLFPNWMIRITMLLFLCYSSWSLPVKVLKQEVSGFSICKVKIPIIFDRLQLWTLQLDKAAGDLEGKCETILWKMIFFFLFSSPFLSLSAPIYLSS